MKTLSMLFLGAMSISPSFSQGVDLKTPALACDVGPVPKVFGKTEWLVYSCVDGKTIAIVTAPGNPAMPFYFFFSPGKDGYQLYGEGTGKKESTTAAFEDIKTLTERDIATIIQQTKQKTKP